MSSTMRASPESRDPIAGGLCHRGKLEVAGNKGHKQAGKADRTVVPLRQNPLAIGSVIHAIPYPQIYTAQGGNSIGFLTAYIMA